MRLIALFAALLLLPASVAQADGPASPEPNTSVSSPINENPVPQEPPASETPASCDFASLVGQKESEIDRSQFGDRPVRTLKPGQMVTMEFLDGRINLHVDDSGVITSVTCG